MLQGVHESRGVTDDYLKLESLIQKVVSPYLGTHGLYIDDSCVAQCSCVLGEDQQLHTAFSIHLDGRCVCLTIKE